MTSREIAYYFPITRGFANFQEKLKQNIEVASSFDGKVQLVIGCFGENQRCVDWLLSSFAKEIEFGIVTYEEFKQLPFWHYAWVMNSLCKERTARYTSSLFDVEDALTVEQVDQTLDIISDHTKDFLIHHYSGNWSDGTLSHLTFPSVYHSQLSKIKELMPQQFCEQGLILHLIVNYPSLIFVFQSGENFLEQSDFCRTFLSSNQIRVNQLSVELQKVKSQDELIKKNGGNLAERIRYDFQLNSSYLGWKLSKKENVRKNYLHSLLKVQNDFTRSNECRKRLTFLFTGEDLNCLELTDEITLYSVNCNNFFFINAWLSHYRSLGVQRFVIIDDGSLHPLREYMPGKDVYILRPRFGTFRTSKVFWLKTLMSNFQKPDSWVLTVDIDEFLDLPSNSTVQSASSLLNYCDFLELNDRFFATGILLDMMPSPDEKPGEIVDFQKSMNWYYFRPIAEEYGYQDYEQVKWSFGDYWPISFSVDIRFRLFGTIDSLRKIPLFRFSQDLDLNQGFHNLLRDGKPMTWEELLKSEYGVLPLKHYKMLKIFAKNNTYDDILDRKDQYFEQTRKNLDFMQSIEKKYIERVWQTTSFKREYLGSDSFPYTNRLLIKPESH
ncbi:MAG: glycosyltransferase family 2 protein [Bacteroidetes bacterium]|nr:glycosyltransferase family 2 protein [Bacteroidota bacterium]